MVRHLSPELPVYGLSIHLLEEYPPEGFRTEELASLYVREIKRIQPRGPYLLAGISYGGIIAVEMARKLRAAGEDIRLLALFDTRLPGALPAASGEEKMRRHREKFRTEGLGYLVGKSTEKLRFKWLEFIEQCGYLYSKILLRLYIIRYGTRELPVFLKEFTANNQNEEALSHYQPQPYDGNITLFKSMERLSGDVSLLDPLLGWGAFATGGIEVIDCPGNHFDMLADPHAEMLAMKLMHAIERSLQKTAPVAESATEGIVIRAGQRGDLQLFRDVSLRSIRESPDAFVATLDQVQDEPPTYWEQLLDFIIESPLDAICLAFHDQRCIGFTAARIDSNDPASSQLRWMWVESNFRGKGVGARLLETVIDWANSRGARRMELHVSESQKGAIRLYESKGFADTGERGFLRPGSALRTRKMVYEAKSGGLESGRG